MYCWKLKVTEYEHGEDEAITRYYETRELAVQHGFEAVKKVLLEVAGWNELLNDYELIEALKNAKESFYLVTSTYDEITEIERKSPEYIFLDHNNIAITLKLIPIIDTI